MDISFYKLATFVCKDIIAAKNATRDNTFFLFQENVTKFI